MNIEQAKEIIYKNSLMVTVAESHQSVLNEMVYRGLVRSAEVNVNLVEGKIDLYIIPNITAEYVKMEVCVR